MQSQGYAVERCGFSGFGSKTWVFLPRIEEQSTSSAQNSHRATIEQSGDLRIYLSRAFLLPLTIAQTEIDAPDGHIQHFLGQSGLINVKFQT
jgi:hypothetical protein